MQLPKLCWSKDDDVYYSEKLHADEEDCNDDESKENVELFTKWIRKAAHYGNNFNLNCSNYFKIGKNICFDFVFEWKSVCFVLLN